MLLAVSGNNMCLVTVQEQVLPHGVMLAMLGGAFTEVSAPNMRGDTTVTIWGWHWWDG